MVLQPLPTGLGTVLAEKLPPSKTCEVCGKVTPVGDLAINVMCSFKFQVGSPGHPGITPFQCPFDEHWACSPDCLLQAAHACIEEHIVPILKEIHTRLGTQ